MSTTTNSPAGSPSFVVDPGSVVRNSGRQVDWTKVGENRRRTAGQIVKLSAAASAAATSITVDALAAALANGTVLNFTGTNKFAQVNDASALAGDTSVTVLALPEALADNDEAVVAGSGSKWLPAGTVVEEATASNVTKISPRVGGSGSAAGLLATDANEDSTVESKSGYGVFTGGKFYESLLPDAAGSPRVLDATIKAELVALPDGMSFEPYYDSSAA